MKRVAPAIAVATAASLVLASCSESTSESFPREIGNFFAGFGNPETYDIDFPDTLPRHVGAVAVNVVAFDEVIHEPQPKSSDESATYSGVRISKTQYLGPGHGVFDEDTNRMYGGIEVCGRIDIDAESTGPTVTLHESNETINLHGTETSAAKLYTPYRAGSSTDAALFSTDTINSRQVQFHGQPISDKELTVGEQLYFVNYEAAQDGQPRTPFELNLPSGTDIKSHAAPEETAGVVVGIDNLGRADVLVGMKNYGVMDDPYLRPGASGGAVFAEDGSLVGLSNRAAFSKKTNKLALESLKQAEEKYDVRLHGIAADARLEEVIVTPVDHPLVKKLRHGLAKAAHCTEPTE